jgi:hypothetical protein
MGIGSRLIVVIAATTAALGVSSMTTPKAAHVRTQSPVNAPRQTTLNADCEKARDSCIESCGNYRKQCDKNHPGDSDYCVKQQNRCEKACNDAWKKCSETPPQPAISQ